ncbi:MAG: putative ATPase, partial [Myxococcota bacterium]
MDGQDHRTIRRGSTIGSTTLRRAQKGSTRDTAQPGTQYFVGRREELETAYAVVADAFGARSARVLNLYGDEGSGRTHLTSELLGILEGSGKAVRVYRANLADPSAEPLLTQLLRHRFALRGTVGQTPQAALDQLTLGVAEIVDPAHLDDAVRLLASLVGLTVDERGQPLPGFDPDVVRTPAFRVRAVATAVNLFRYDLSLTPQLLVLDDWDRAARPGDLIFVEQLMAALAASPLAVVVVSERELAPPVALPEPGQTRTQQLVPLAPADSERMVRGLLENVESLPDALVLATASRAAGNPAMALELVRLLVERGQVRSSEQSGTAVWRYSPGTHTPSSLPMPGDVHAAVRERLDGFEPAQLRLLESAAVAGASSWSGGLLSIARADAAPEQSLELASPLAEASIADLVDMGLLDVVFSPLLERGEAYAFASPALLDAAYERLEPSRKALLHRLWAQWLQRQIPAERLPWLALVAHHLESGG